MIPGIVAAQLAGGEGVPGWVPAGANIHLDFINGLYWVSAEVTAADVIDHPDWITGNGLEIIYAHETTPGTGVAHYIGAVLAALVTLDWTIVIEYEEFYDGGQTKPLVMTDDAFGAYLDELSIVRESGGGGTISVLDYDDDTSTNRYRPLLSSYSIGTHRIAVTRRNVKLSISADGEATQSNVTSNAGVVLDRAAIGSSDGEYLYNDFYLRSFTVYDTPKLDADLPALTA
jgi:hypothetical protein